MENNINNFDEIEDSLRVISNGLLNFKKTLFDEIDKMYSYFSDNQKRVINCRFLNVSQKSREETAKELGISLSRVGQIETGLYRSVIHPVKKRELYITLRKLYAILSIKDSGLVYLNDIKEFLNSNDYFDKLVFLMRVTDTIDYSPIYFYVKGVDFHPYYYYLSRHKYHKDEGDKLFEKERNLVWSWCGKLNNSYYANPLKKQYNEKHLFGEIVLALFAEGFDSSSHNQQELLLKIYEELNKLVCKDMFKPPEKKVQHEVLRSDDFLHIGFRTYKKMDPDLVLNDRNVQIVDTISNFVINSYNSKVSYKYLFSYFNNVLVFFGIENHFYLNDILKRGLKNRQGFYLDDSDVWYYQPKPINHIKTIFEYIKASDSYVTMKQIIDHFPTYPSEIINKALNNYPTLINFDSGYSIYKTIHISNLKKDSIYYNKIIEFVLSSEKNVKSKKFKNDFEYFLWKSAHSYNGDLIQKGRVIENNEELYQIAIYFYKKINKV